MFLSVITPLSEGRAPTGLLTFLPLPVSAFHVNGTLLCSLVFHSVLGWTIRASFYVVVNRSFSLTHSMCDLPPLYCWLTFGILRFFALHIVPLWNFYFVSFSDHIFMIFLLLLLIYLELFVHRLCLCSFIVDATKLFSKGVIPVYVHTCIVYVFQFIHIFVNTWYSLSFSFFENFWQLYCGIMLCFKYTIPW